MQNTNLIFRQMFEAESFTYTYLLADPISKEGILIDPVHETVERDLKIIEELQINLKYVLDTHVHADHITGSSLIKKSTGAKIVLGSGTRVECCDLLVEDKQELEFGGYKVRVLATPGHTDGCTSYSVENMIFTGDTLLIRGCGRTDFQEGSPNILYKSIHEQIFTLPDETTVYPGHNYNGLTSSSVGEEKRFNPRLGNNKTIEEFSQIMNNLNLQNPKKIEQAVPANLKCGDIS